jgi:hypothetical protein
MSGNNTTAIPTPVAPLVDENGQVTVPWRAWFTMIAGRTGGAVGFTLPTTVDVAGQIVAGVTWTSGLGQPLAVVDPTKWPTSGSIYSQTDGILGARIFVAQGNGTWLPLAGV